MRSPGAFRRFRSAIQPEKHVATFILLNCASDYPESLRIAHEGGFLDFRRNARTAGAERPFTGQHASGAGQAAAVCNAPSPQAAYRAHIRGMTPPATGWSAAIDAYERTGPSLPARTGHGAVSSS